MVWFANKRISRSAEMVSLGHPDKFMDRVADAIVDVILPGGTGCRAAIEGVIKDNRLTLKGEVKTDALPDVAEIARTVWKSTYPFAPELEVVTDLRQQSANIASMTDIGCAVDQGIMVGYATNETPEMLPLEYALARRLMQRLIYVRETGMVDWLLADAKCQVTLNPEGKVRSVIIASHHIDRPDLMEGVEPNRRMSTRAVEEIYRSVITPVIADFRDEMEPNVTFNGVGVFIDGGPFADAGEVGRKIVVDAYGPRIPVGGGAYSGKDPTKVDRSAAYMARHIAKSLLVQGMAQECLVSLAYAIGKHEPEMVTAITETGEDLGDWVRKRFDLSPWGIIAHLNLWSPQGWSYQDTAANGHYGNNQFPWEQGN